MANERTALAWRRSALSLLTVAALTLHAALDARVRPFLVATAAILAAAAGWADNQGRRTYCVRTGGEDSCRATSPRVFGVLSTVTLLAAAATAAQIAGWP